MFLRLRVKIKYNVRTDYCLFSLTHQHKKNHRAPDRLPERELRMLVVAVQEPARQHGRHPPRLLWRHRNDEVIGSSRPVSNCGGSGFAGGRDRGAAHRGVSRDHDVTADGGGRWRQGLRRGRRPAAARHLRWGQLIFLYKCSEK